LGIGKIIITFYSPSKVFIDSLDI